MKKLLIAAAIVCAAAVSQAATIKWTTDVLYAPNADGSFTSTTLYSDKTDTYALNVALTFYAYDNAESTWKAIGSGEISNTTTDKLAKSGKATNTTGIYNFLQNTDYRYSAEYELVFNGKMYTMSVPESAETQFTQNLGSGSFALTVADAGKWTPESVPEPTSGLLLLLGVAGLALRRRRA